MEPRDFLNSADQHTHVRRSAVVRIWVEPLAGDAEQWMLMVELATGSVVELGTTSSREPLDDLLLLVNVLEQ